jgi:hypothetical protein
MDADIEEALRDLKIAGMEYLDLTPFELLHVTAEASALLEWSDGRGWEDLREVSNDHQYYVTIPSGTAIRADRRSRNHWSLTVTSPPSPSGKTIRITQNVPGEKDAIYTAIGKIAQDISLLHQALQAAKERIVGNGMTWENTSAEERPLLMLLLSPTELPFDQMYDSFNGSTQEDLDDTGKMRKAFHTRGRDLVVLTAIALHEMWRELADKQYEEDKVMAKNTGGMVWWEITGGATSLNKIVNSLTHNRHTVVLDNKQRVYLKVQHAEQRFVDGLTSRYNCRAKLVDEPDYGETLCGKLHLQPELHSHRCNACHRVKDNNERAAQTKAEKEVAGSQAQYVCAKVDEAETIQRNMTAIAREPAYPSTTSPDGVFTSGLGSTLPANPIIPPLYPNEQREWEARNGPIITIQGPAPRQSNDIEGLAQEYRRVSDELVERASYYATLAEKYEALLLPTDAVREAEAALEAAKMKDQEDREAQIKALQDMLAAGPPA